MGSIGRDCSRRGGCAPLELRGGTKTKRLVDVKTASPPEKFTDLQKNLKVVDGFFFVAMEM